MSPRSYRDAGVDVAAGDALVSRIRGWEASDPCRPGQLSGPGGFAALFDVAALGYRRPVLVSGCDGVGTKLRLAQELGRHRGIGIDLVAMCVNDVLVYGARPLYFLDYYATAGLCLQTATEVLQGIRDGCEQAVCGLAGGETAELPGMYPADCYDLAGFCVGVVEKARLIDGSAACAGDVLLALASSGCHANGYSLIRQVLADSPDWAGQMLQGRSLADWLLQPTRIYVHDILALLEHVSVRSMAHITGGGLSGNVPRTLPSGVLARIDLDSWVPPPIFQWLATAGDIAWSEMYRTFNCGVGMVLCVRPAEAEPALAVLRERGLSAWRCGELAATGTGVARVCYTGSAARGLDDAC